MSELLERCRRLLSTGRSGEAVALLEEESARGGGPAVLAMLGYALYHESRIVDARRILAGALDRFPFDPVLQEASARMRWMGGEGKHFADDFLAAVAQRPGDSALRFKCADLLRQAGDMDRAEQLMREGLARQPADARLAAWLGVLLDETARFDEALLMQRDITAAFPNEPVLRLNLAHTLLRAGQGEDAMREIAFIRGTLPEIQLAITYEAMALKQLRDPRHDWLCDYNRHVQIYDIAPPDGFSSVTEFNAALAARLRGAMDASHHPLDQSLRGGSQTSYNLIFDRDPVLRAYFDALERPIRSYIAAVGADARHPLDRRKTGAHKLSGCWSVLLRPGGFHVNHTHPNGWISSAYYVSLPASVNANSQEGWIKFGEPRWPVPGVGVERVVQPKEGRLVLFPSYMWHGTIPFSTGERLTAPFDVVPA